MVTLVFELSLRLRPAPLRCPHGDCGSRSIIKYGKGKRKNIPDVQRYLCKACGRTFCDRAGTPYYRKHYPALVMLTCLNLFHSLNTPMRRQARLVPHVPRKPSHRTVMRWQRDFALFFTRLKKARLNSGRVWLGDERQPQARRKAGLPARGPGLRFAGGAEQPPRSGGSRGSRRKPSSGGPTREPGGSRRSS
ncbi:MAG: hypothetical protein Q6352_008940 [Candidatus Freyrarchaeum guaymaensis]